MKKSTVKRLCFRNHLTALLSLLVVWVLALPARIQADEFPIGCSLSGGGLGNTSQGGINFPLNQAHVGDIVPVVPSLGMVLNACQAINATGSVWIASGRLTNFLINVTLDPGPLISCPSDPLCRPGPYNVLITPALVGAGVNSPNGSIPGAAKTVRAVQNGEGTVRTGATPEQLADFHTASLSIVTPCIQVFKFCPTNCTPAGAPIDFTGYVTNCGDIRLTNVTIVDSRTPNLFTPAGLPLFQPIILDPGQAVAFKGSYAPTLAETCAGTAANTITVRGTDITIIQGPNASVTNSATVSCPICITPCLSVTKLCTPAVLGGPQTISGGVTNCGNIAITNIVISDNQYGAVTTIPSLAAGAGTTYSKTFTATVCGTTTNIVTASGTTVCGAPISASATGTCFVDCPPCIKVDKKVACAIGPGTNCGTFGEIAIGVKNPAATPPQNPAFCYSITVSNCGAIALTNNRVLDDKLGDLTGSYFPSSSTVFPVGGTITRIFKASWANNTTNTVSACGQSILTGATVCDTNDAVAIVIPASVRCNMQITSPDDRDGNPNDGHVSIPQDGNPHNVTFTVTITAGPVPLANVTLTSPTLAGLGCVLPPPFSLPANSNFTYVCTAPVNCTSIPGGVLTNVAGISGVVDTSGGLCGYNANGQPITVTSAQSGDACAVVIQCLAQPKICVTKEVACELPTGCGSYSDVATGAKTADDTQCPSFCYRVRVTNCGQEALNNVTVVDNVISLAGCNFPPTLAVGQTVECIVAGVEHCQSVTNTVTASGVGASSGIGVSTNDTAAVVILPIDITCNVTVNGKPFIQIPCDGQGHLVTNEVEICNTGSLPLSNIMIMAPDVEARGCTNFPNGLSLLPGECTNVLLCIDLVTCPPSCGLAFSNHVVVMATVNTNLSPVCSWTRNESNQVVAVKATTECEAQVGCTVPNACRTTGGGRQDDPLVYPANVRYVTHGGQVGAPVGNKVCTVVEEFYLGNPCIHGRWTHVRHQQGGLRGNFHARYYDTLDCACLDTNTTTGTVIVPGVNGAANQTYVNLIYGPGTVTEGVCNADDHKVAGPQPRPAPANKMVFTGVGDWADPNGRRTPRATLFRVDLEDRSEPGGSHPKGSVNPPDRYRIRIWVLTADEIRLLKGAATSGGITDRYLLNFRNAISACIGLNVQDGATVPNGTAVFGVRAPDIDDGGELERGNRQIHPAIKDCDPANPKAPPVPPDRS